MPVERFFERTITHIKRVSGRASPQGTRLVAYLETGTASAVGVAGIALATCALYSEAYNWSTGQTEIAFQAPPFTERCVADTMTDPALFAEANSLIRSEQYDVAVEKLMAGIADLPLTCHAKAYRLAGLAFYFSERWAEALSMFTVAANGSEVPEDWFNVAMAQARIGDTSGARASWQKVFDLSYAHQDAPETSTFFQKKLMFAQLMLEVGAADELGLDLLERQLMGFYTHDRVTDSHFWISRGVPAFSEVMDATRGYYRAMHKTEAEWSAFCDRVAAAVDEEGKVYCEEIKRGYKAG